MTEITVTSARSDAAPEPVQVGQKNQVTMIDDTGVQTVMTREVTHVQDLPGGGRIVVSIDTPAAGGGREV